MNKEDIDEHRYMYGDPLIAAQCRAGKKKAKKKETAMEFAFRTVKITRAEAEKLFKEPRKNEST